jgi:exosortase
MRINLSELAAHIKIHLYFYVLIAFIIIINLPALAELIRDWTLDPNYSHGFLIIPISIYLIYRKRKELVFPSKPANQGIILLAIGCFGIIFGTAASEYFSTRFSLTLIITGLSLYYLGRDNFKKVWFAFFFLLFMIPIPAIIYYAATLPMQLFASKITNNILHLIGVASIRHGNIIHLPGYMLEVAEACSGLRSLSTLLALAALYGHLTLPGTIRPLILFFSAIPIAIIANIIRLTFTAVGAYAVSTELAEDFLHEVSGMLVFISSFIILIILGAILKWRKINF